MDKTNETKQKQFETKERIERVDSLPLIIYWLVKMKFHTIIDAIWKPHGNWQGLSYGQLALLFATYVLHRRTHRLSGMEEWQVSHQTVLEEVTGWELELKDSTDDRVGQLLTILGSEEEPIQNFQRQMGRHLIRAYDLPTKVGRYDTTSFSVHHEPPSSSDEGEGGVLSWGHSKDRRPDLLQFKQGLGTLDPAGVPIFTNTIAGQAADDPLYVPAWREMKQAIGHSNFLFVADCKAAALATRATIDLEQGYCLFPLPMTGNVPAELQRLVLKSPDALQPVILEGVLDEDGQPLQVGIGFSVEKEMRAELEDGTIHIWTERWLVAQSTAHAHRQRQSLQQRLRKAEQKFQRMRPKKDENTTEFQLRAERVLQHYHVTNFITLNVTETVTPHKKYIGPGRPGPNRSYEMVEKRQFHCHYQRNEAAIQQQMELAGWRIYVTNTADTQMTLNQAVTYYRDEWIAERGFHRFKTGSRPALPLCVRLPTRIRGLMLLLTVALQALTLLDFVAQRQLAAEQETISGLVPGNPKMKTARPSAERLLAQFTNLHLLINETQSLVSGKLVETLTPLQKRILALLDVPETIYLLTFNRPALKFNDTS